MCGESWQGEGEVRSALHWKVRARVPTWHAARGGAVDSEGLRVTGDLYG